MKRSVSGNTESNIHNLISLGTKIKGDIETDGDLRIDGSLIGNIITKGKLVVGDSASIEGTIECENSDISGKVVAKLKVNNLLLLKESARFSGDIITKKISIEPGAVFSGSCQMTSENLNSMSQKKDAKEKK